MILKRIGICHIFKMALHNSGIGKRKMTTRPVRSITMTSQRRDGVSNHQPHHCLFNRLFRRRSKKTSKLRVTGLCEGNSPVTSEFPAQGASNAENVSIGWRHHALLWYPSVSLPRAIQELTTMCCRLEWFVPVHANIDLEKVWISSANENYKLNCSVLKQGNSKGLVHIIIVKYYFMSCHVMSKLYYIPL